MAQKQRLVEVQADFERTRVNRAIDQWSKQAFVKAKGQHTWTLAIYGILYCVDRWNVLKTLIISEDR